MIFRSNVLALAVLPFALGVAAIAPWAFQDRGKISGGGRPICSAGSPQTVECTGPTTLVFLDATGSTNPRQDPLTYRWELCHDTRVSIDDVTSPTPTLYVDMSSSCSVSCTVFLVVKNGSGASNCSVSFTVQDTTAAAITCPADVTVFEGDPTDPSATGTATATDARNPNPIIGYTDVSAGTTSNAILRTWTADDGCQVSSCLQTITIEQHGAHIDIKPGQCPNLIDVNHNDFAVGDIIDVGVLGNSFDVTQVDLGSLGFGRPGNFAFTGTIQPKSVVYEDIGTPFVGEGCQCHTLTGDGVLDLHLRFSKREMVEYFALDQEPNGAVVELEVQGLMLDEVLFSGTDCIQIINN